MTLTGSETGALILALASLGRVGPVRIKMILAHATEPAEILDWDRARFEEIPGISTEIASHIAEKLDLADGRRLMEWAEKHEYSVLTLADPIYPPALRELYDCPPFLFLKGVLSESDNRAVAMVGARRATEYGRMTASQIAGELARRQVTVVSGLAVGIDSASHQGALDGGGRTIAVLGSGIDVVYPPSNRTLYDRIAEHGAVISEFFPGVEPAPGHFPRRNRVIAGLSQAVIVVEAGNKSGALLTADLALAQSRKLFAVPGNLSSKLSAGTNELIKSGAHIMTSVDDIFSVLPALKNNYIPAGTAAVADLTEGERLIIERLSRAPKQMDTLVRECCLSVTDASSYLLSLELRGLVKQLSGKRFIAI